MLSKAGPEAVESYVSKLFAQRLFADGRFDAALAMAKSLEPPVGVPDESAEEAATRLRLVLAPEAFVIGHELTHVLLAQIDTARHDLTDQLLGLLGTRRPMDRFSDAFARDWDGSIRAALERYGYTSSTERYDPGVDAARRILSS